MPKKHNQELLSAQTSDTTTGWTKLENGSYIVSCYGTIGAGTLNLEMAYTNDSGTNNALAAIAAGTGISEATEPFVIDIADRTKVRADLSGATGSTSISLALSLVD